MGLFNSDLENRVARLEDKLDQILETSNKNCTYTVYPEPGMYSFRGARPKDYKLVDVVRELIDTLGYEVKAPYTQKPLRVEKVCRTTKKS